MHHNILRQKRSSNTKIHFVISDCSQEMLITMPPQALAMIAMLWLLKIRKVLCTPCCHGWPRASRGRLSRFPQIIVGSSLSSADPHWPDFLPFPAVTLLWRLLQSRLQKTDGDEETKFLQEGWWKSAAFSFGPVRYFWVGPKIQNPSWGPLIGSSYDLASWLLACEPKIGPRW